MHIMAHTVGNITSNSSFPPAEVQMLQCHHNEEQIPEILGELNTYRKATSTGHIVVT